MLITAKKHTQFYWKINDIIYIRRMFDESISVVVIARNAEKLLAKCLESVRDFASEIIVVINDCTDSTPEIARSYGATVVNHKWAGFCAQKNFAMSLATCKWVVSLDADEVVSDKLKRSVLKFVKNTENFSGAKFNRRTFFMGKWIYHGDWYPDCSLRLVKNGCGKWSGGFVHEKLIVDGNIKKLNGDLLHYSFESLNNHILKNIQYADLAISADKSSGKHCSVFSAVMHSEWKFFRGYFLKCGFLDGLPGYYIAKSQAFLTLYKYTGLSKNADWDV